MCKAQSSHTMYIAKLIFKCRLQEMHHRRVMFHSITEGLDYSDEEQPLLGCSGCALSPIQWKLCIKHHLGLQLTVWTIQVSSFSSAHINRLHCTHLLNQPITQ